MSLKNLWRKIDKPVDFVGQSVANDIVQIGLVSFAVIGFAISFFTRTLWYTWAVPGAGSLIILAVVVPPWPFLRRNPIVWQDPIELAVEEPQGAKKKPKKSKKAKKAKKTRTSSEGSSTD